MPELLTIQQFRDLMKKGKVTTGKRKAKKGNGSKAKLEMDIMLKLAGFKLVPCKGHTFNSDEYCREHRFSKDRAFRFDWAIPALRIGIEYEGLMSEKSGHTTVTGYSKDVEKYNLAQQEGWTVMRYTILNYTQLADYLNTLK